MNRVARPALLVTLAAAAAGAPLLPVGCGGDPTSVVVRVSSDLTPGVDFNQIEIAVATKGGGHTEVPFPVNEPSDLPVALAIIPSPSHDPGETFDVTATAQIVGGSDNVVSTSVQIAFIPGQAALVWLELSRQCINVNCGGDSSQTCENGNCGDRRREPSPYDPHSGVPDLRVQYLAMDTGANTRQVQPYFTIINSGEVGVPIEELTLRYWYSSDGLVGLPVGACDYASQPVAKEMVTLDFKTGIGPYEDFTDSYMEVGFAPSSGNIIARVGTLTLQTRFYGPDFNMMFTQTNDYSFDPTKTAFTDWSRVTLYRNGRLIWGTEPRAN